MLYPQGIFPQRNRQGRKTHGRSRTRTYRIWAGMKARCTNPREPRYSDYGGRGITVCHRWVQFDNFLADMGDAPDGMTLERKKNDDNYRPENCRWVTYAEQNRNRRDTVLITYAGVTRCATDWEKLTGISRRAIVYRHKRGWPLHEVLGLRPVVTLSPVERKARAAVRQRLRRAVCAGKVTKPLACELCGHKRKVQAHHYKGYAAEYALDVKWVCCGCHRSHAGPSSESDNSYCNSHV